MTIVVDEKIRSILPPSVRRRPGFKAGDQLEVKDSGGIVSFIPKLPTADDEYTPEQRVMIDAHLDEAEKGPFHGPFNNADEMIAHMKGELKKRAIKNSKRSR